MENNLTPIKRRDLVPPPPENQLLLPTYPLGQAQRDATLHAFADTINTVDPAKFAKIKAVIKPLLVDIALDAGLKNQLKDISQRLKGSNPVTISEEEIGILKGILPNDLYKELEL